MRGEERIPGILCAVAVGITSACAEKRIVSTPQSKSTGNYLRMRGEEDDAAADDACPDAELPPHARRRAQDSRRHRVPLGITSACAEKSIIGAFSQLEGGNYLRMRGEEIIAA